jgi:hypothetical protein
MVTRKMELSVARTAGVWDVERAGGGAWETAWLNSFKRTDEDEDREASYQGGRVKLVMARQTIVVGKRPLYSHYSRWHNPAASCDRV